MFADLPGKTAGRIFLIRRFANSRYVKGFQIGQGSEIAILHDQATDQFLEIEARLLHARERSNVEQPQIFLSLQFGQGIVRKTRRNHDFYKRSGNFLGRSHIDWTIKRNDAAERRNRIGLTGFHISFERCRTQGHTAGIIVFDNGDGDVVVFFCQLER